MKLVKFLLPAMLLTLSVSAEPDCRVYSPKENQGKVVDGEWVPDAGVTE